MAMFRSPQKLMVSNEVGRSDEFLSLTGIDLQNSLAVKTKTSVVRNVLSDNEDKQPQDENIIHKAKLAALTRVRNEIIEMYPDHTTNLPKISERYTEYLIRLENLQAACVNETFQQ